MNWTIISSNLLFQSTPKDEMPYGPGTKPGTTPLKSKSYLLGNQTHFDSKLLCILCRAKVITNVIETTLYDDDLDNGLALNRRFVIRDVVTANFTSKTWLIVINTQII